MANAWLEGMMLAAVIADDESGHAAEAGLAPALGAALRDGLAALASEPRDVRRSRVTRMATALRHVSPQTSVPPIAARLLASEVPRDVGRAWLASAPPVHRGFRPGPGIKATLRRSTGPMDPDAADHERQAAGTLDVVFSPSQAASLRRWAARLAGGRSADRVLGALALGAGSPDRAGDALTRDLRRIGAELGRVWSTSWRV